MKIRYQRWLSFLFYVLFIGGIVLFVIGTTYYFSASISESRENFYNYRSSNGRITEAHFDRVYNDLTKAIQDDPSHTDLYLARAESLERRHDYQAAAEDFYRYVTDYRSKPCKVPAMEFTGGNKTLTYSLEIKYTCDMHIIPIRLSQSQHLSVTAISSGVDYVDSLIVLLDPDGVPITASNHTYSNTDTYGRYRRVLSRGATIPTIQLEQDDIYTLIVTHAGFDGLWGGYGDIAVNLTLSG
ncbi:MAG: hypothetical protein ACPG7F_03145 [Aggregatilineales bacterium]